MLWVAANMYQSSTEHCVEYINLVSKLAHTKHNWHIQNTGCLKKCFFLVFFNINKWPLVGFSGDHNTNLPSFVPKAKICHFLCFDQQQSHWSLVKLAGCNLKILPIFEHPPCISHSADESSFVSSNRNFHVTRFCLIHFIDRKTIFLDMLQITYTTFHTCVLYIFTYLKE